MYSLIEIGLANAALASLLALFALAVGRWSKRPALVHCLWLLVLLKLLTPPFVPLSLPLLRPEPQANEIQERASEQLFAAAEPPTPTTDGRDKVNQGKLARVSDLPGAAGVEFPMPQPVPVVAPRALVQPDTRPPLVIDRENLTTIAAAAGAKLEPIAWATILLNTMGLIWLSGTIICLVLMFGRIARFQRLLRLAKPAPTGLRNQARALARRLGLAHCPEVFIIPGPLPPLLWATGAPRLYFPEALLARLSPEGQAALLVHELAHLRRGDHIVRFIELFAQALYWWYPLVWFARRQLQAAEEECCDAWVVGELPGVAHHYAGALLDTIDFLSQKQMPLPMAASGFGRMYFLKRRLAMIVRCATPRGLSLPGRLAILFAMLLLPLAPTIGRFAADAKPQAKEPSPAVANEVASNSGSREEPFSFAQQPLPFRQSSTGEVWSTDVSPDCKNLAVGSGGTGEGGELVLWDLPDGRERAALRTTKPIRCVRFSPDGKLLATAEFDQTAKLRDPATGQVIRTFLGHAASLNFLVFTPDGKRLITASLDKTIKIWNIEDGKELATLTGHTDWVLGLALSRDGKTLASASKDMTVRLWDLTTNKELKQLKGHTALAECVGISPDAKLVVSGGADNTVRFWDADKGTLLHTRTAHTFPVTAVSFNADGTQVATTAYGNSLRIWETKGCTQVVTISPTHAKRTTTATFLPGGKEILTGSFDTTVKIWNIADKTLRTTLTPRSQRNEALFPLLAVAYSNDGSRVALAGEDRSVRILDAKGEPLLKLEGHTDAVSGVAFSPDGQLIATSSFDRTLRVWNAFTGQERFALKGHTNWVFGVAFSPDGQTLASAGYDKTVRLWDVTTGLERRILKGHKGTVRAVAFSRDGKWLASGSGDKTIKIWNMENGEERTTLKGHEGAVRAISFTPDGLTVASGSEDNSVRIWDVATSKEKANIKQNDIVTCVAFSPRGTLLASAGMEQNIYIHDPVTGAARTILPGSTDIVTALAFSPDAQTLLTVGLDSTVLRWNGTFPPVTPKLTYNDHTGQVWFAALSPDGTILASAGDDKKVVLRRLGSSVSLPSLKEPSANTLSIAYSADGKLMATSHFDNTIRLWEMPSGKLKNTLNAHQFQVYKVAFSPDGKTLASAAGVYGDEDPGELKLWDVETGKEKDLALNDHTGPLFGVAFSPDGKILASCSGDGTVKLWDPESGKVLHDLTGHDKLVRGIAFNPKGDLLASAGADGTVRLWDPITGKEVAKLPIPGERACSPVFSADGTMLAAGYNTGATDDKSGAIAWTVADRKEIRRYSDGTVGRVLGVAFSLDGKLIAVVGGLINKSAKAKLYDRETGKEVANLTGPTNWLECVDLHAGWQTCRGRWRHR